MWESSENFSSQTPEQQVDAFLESLNDSDFWVLAVMRKLIDEQIKEFLLSTDVKNCVLHWALGRFILPKSTSQKILEQKKKMHPLLDKLIGSPSIKQALTQHAVAVETSTLSREITQEGQQLQNDVTHPLWNTNNSMWTSWSVSTPSTQAGSNTQLSENHSIDSARWAEIPRERVERAWNYINNDWTFYSPSKWICIRWKWQYKGVCTTWVWNVLHLLTWLPLPCNLEIDGTDERPEEMWERLNAMNCYKILDSVDPTNPSVSWYVPKDGDVAVRPRFQSDHGQTQHMACYINGHWVSDTIQPCMSCYNATPQKKRNPYEPNVKIYRYNPNMNHIYYS